LTLESIEEGGERQKTICGEKKKPDGKKGGGKIGVGDRGLKNKGKRGRMFQYLERGRKKEGKGVFWNLGGKALVLIKKFLPYLMGEKKRKGCFSFGGNGMMGSLLKMEGRREKGTGIFLGGGKGGGREIAMGGKRIDFSDHRSEKSFWEREKRGLVFFIPGRKGGGRSRGNFSV